MCNVNVGRPSACETLLSHFTDYRYGVPAGAADFCPWKHEGLFIYFESGNVVYIKEQKRTDKAHWNNQMKCFLNYDRQNFGSQNDDSK